MFFFAYQSPPNNFRLSKKAYTHQRVLPDEKREAVLLYYFFDMNDAEIAKLRDVPRSTVQYRRTSSFELLKRYLEEHAYGKNDW